MPTIMHQRTLRIILVLVNLASHSNKFCARLHSQSMHEIARTTVREATRSLFPQIVASYRVPRFQIESIDVCREAPFLRSRWLNIKFKLSFVLKPREPRLLFFQRELQLRTQYRHHSFRLTFGLRIRIIDATARCRCRNKANNIGRNMKVAL